MFILWWNQTFAGHWTMCSEGCTFPVLGVFGIFTSKLACWHLENDSVGSRTRINKMFELHCSICNVRFVMIFCDHLQVNTHLISIYCNATWLTHPCSRTVSFNAFMHLRVSVFFFYRPASKALKQVIGNLDANQKCENYSDKTDYLNTSLQTCLVLTVFLMQAKGSVMEITYI